MTVPGLPFGGDHVAAVRAALSERFPTAEVTVFSWYGEEVRASLVFPSGDRLSTILTRGRQDAPSPESTALKLGEYFEAKNA